MLKNIKNVLLYNSGGGLGDSLLMIPLIQWLKDYYQLSKIHYIQNGIQKHFETSLKDFDNGFVHTINFLPENYAFFKLTRIKNYSHFKFGKQMLETIGIKKFDLIIDGQTRVNNSLVLKSIPHKYFISPSCRFLLSKPKKFIYNSKHVCGRIFDYFEKTLNINVSIPTELNYIQEKYLDEASKLFKNHKKYIGFSITAGHPTREKEISLKTIVEVANYFSDKNFVPTFLIEEKYKEKINTIKTMVRNPYFPEHLAQSSLKNPLLVVAMGRKLHSAISINNGIMHMLGLAGTKTAIFFDENSDKFRPLNGNKSKIYSSSKNKETKDLTPKDIINFVNDFT